MTIERGLVSVFLIISGVNFHLHPDISGSLVCLCASVLFGWAIFLEHKALKSDSGIQKQIKDLSNKIEAIYLSKGLGR